MDNKKWYKRASTLFWFLLASAPILLSFIGYIGQFLGKVLVDSSVQVSDYYVTFDIYLVEMKTLFITFTPQWLKDMFTNLFNLIDNTMALDFAYCMAWFSWVYMLELMVDFIIWLPRWFHCILEKGVGKID